MQLRAVGGANDAGVDLRGLVVQCKFALADGAGGAGLGPAAVREFEGALQREPPGTLGVLAARRGLTDAARRCVFGSALPLACLVPSRGPAAQHRLPGDVAGDHRASNLDDFVAMAGTRLLANPRVAVLAPGLVFANPEPALSATGADVGSV
ncbi:hypothetical protein HK405_005826, partial [Cladochytrium tenue]